MTNFSSKYSSDCLTAEQMASAFRALPEVLADLFGECTFTVWYGHGANLHHSLLYIPMSVSTSVLPFFLEDSVGQRIIVPGESDLIVKSPKKELELRYCHHSDIHVDGESEEIIQRFIAARQFSEIHFLSQAEVKKKYPNRQD